MDFVTKRRLDRANLAVTGELNAMGFYDNAVQSVDVYLVPFGFAHGWQFYGRSGRISIPAVSMSRLGNLFRGEYDSLRDILRHEYAHAIADTHRGLIRARQFTDAFGAHHTWDFEWEYDPYFHVTPYAATCPAEDFAEVFMLYLKYHGIIQHLYKSQAVSRKWAFIRRLGNAISNGMRRWKE